jgi:hypothetical protein
MAEKEKDDIVLSKQEVEDLRKVISESAKKDEIIANLEKKMNAMEVSVNKEDIVIDETIPVGTEGHLYKTPEDKWIIGWVIRPNGRAVYKELNPANMTEYLEWIDLIVLGKDKPVKTLFKDIHDYADEKVTFVKKNKLENIVKNEGMRDHMVYDSKVGEMVKSGRKIKAVVVNDNVQSFVVNLDGKEVEIHERFMNPRF